MALLVDLLIRGWWELPTTGVAMIIALVWLGLTVCSPGGAIHEPR